MAYYVFQDDQSPANNRTVIVAPGLDTVNFVIDLTLIPGLNSFLVMAVDRSGNNATSVVQVDYATPRCENFVLFADLSGCDLGRVDLRGLDLTGVDLTGASIGPISELIGTNLTDANLTNAILAWVWLDYVNLTGANLDGVVSLDPILDGVIWSNTQCPDGSNSDIDDGDGFTCLNNLIEPPGDP
ncbi:MAG: pentapeptide repeat-containing protein [Candidatus Hodarchaeota archaeon]